MILSYSSTEKSQTGASIESWLAKLQEGKKSTQQLQSELLSSTTELIKEIQEKTSEKLEEERKEGQKDKEAVEVSVSTMEITSSSDVPETAETSSVEVKA